VTIPAFVGDEVTASAWRLIGARTLVADGDGAVKAFDAALGDAELVLITAAFAAALDSQKLDAAVRRARPLVLVVPDAANRVAPPDLDKAVDRVLGIEQ
jgi:vacuolar-type H+-ATPase subunit F/Vma7